MSYIFKSLDDFAQFCAKVAIQIDPDLTVGCQLAATSYKKELDSILGDENRLRPLTDATQTERLRLGYSGNDPLVRSGEMKDSIQLEHAPLFSAVGTESPLAPLHEFGFFNVRTGEMVAPRPAWQMALSKTEPLAVNVLAGTTAKLLKLSETPFIKLPTLDIPHG